MINPKTQHFMAERMGATIHALPVDHTPMLTAAEKGGHHPEGGRSNALLDEVAW